MKPFLKNILDRTRLPEEPGITAAAIVIAAAVAVVIAGIILWYRADRIEADYIAPATETTLPQPQNTKAVSPVKPTGEPSAERTFCDAYADFLRSKENELLDFITSGWNAPVYESDEGTDYYNRLLDTLKKKKFVLFDIDRNGIPELILINGEIFTYENNDVIKIGEINDTILPSEGGYNIIVIGMPYDGYEGIPVEHRISVGSDRSGSLERVYISDGVATTELIYSWHNNRVQGEPGEDREVTEAYDADGNLLYPPEHEWLRLQNLYTRTIEFQDITDEVIQEVIYNYAPPVLASRRPATADEEAYAGVFEEFRSRGRNDSSVMFKNITEHIKTMADFYYAFYDIDSNGVNELIISDGDGAIIYTLDNDAGTELAFFEGDRSKFSGISGHGYICGHDSNSVVSGVHRFYKIADDGVSVIKLSAYYDYGWDYNRIGSREFVIYSADGRTNVTEIEFDNYVDSMRAPYVELDLHPLTELFKKSSLT